MTSATVSFPPVSNIAKFFTPQRSAKNSVCPGKPKSDLVHPRLMDRTGHNGINLTAERESGAFSSARAAWAVSWVGWPSKQLAFPITNIPRIGKSAKPARSDNLGTDARGIAKCNANAYRRSRPRPYRAICSIGTSTFGANKKRKRAA